MSQLLTMMVTCAIGYTGGTALAENYGHIFLPDWVIAKMVQNQRRHQKLPLLHNDEDIRKEVERQRLVMAKLPRRAYWNEATIGAGLGVFGWCIWTACCVASNLRR